MQKFVQPLLNYYKMVEYATKIFKNSALIK